jgi:iron complex outermembrane recepter protein
MNVAPPARIPANKVAARVCGLYAQVLSGKTARAFLNVFLMKNRFTGTRAAVLALFAPLGSVVWAQASLPEVVVVASRFQESKLDVPVAIQVITKADIQNSAAMSLPEALHVLGGVNVRSVVGGQLGLYASVDLGGYGVTATQNTLIVVDGHRLNPIDSSEIDWSVIPLSSVERIELALGSAGVQFGAGATGGVIYITTNGKKADRTQLAAQAGSFGTAQLSLNLERAIDDLSLKLHAGADHSDGWRDNSQVNSQNVSVKATKDLGATGSVFAEAVISQSTTGFPGGVLGQVGEGNLRTAKFNNIGSENKVDQQGLRFGGLANLSSQTNLDLDVFVGSKTSTFNRPYYDTADSLAGFFPSPDQIKLDGKDLSVSPKFRSEFLNGASLVYGYDFSQSNQSAVNSYGALAQQFILANQFPGFLQGNLLSDQQSVQLLNHSVYLIGRMPLNAVAELTLGVRRQLQSFDSYDLNTSVGFPQTASGTMAANAHEAGLNFKLNETNRIYLRISQSYRFANTDEYWGFDPVTFNRVFSGTLRPQTSKAYELGYDFKDERQQFSAVVGQSVTQDEIRYDPATFKNGNLSDNIDRTSLSLNWTALVLDKSHVSLGARLQRAQYATGSYSGQTLGLVPSAIYNLGWIQDLAGNSRVGVQVTHVSKQNYDASPSTTPTLAQMPAYTTADVFWARTYGKLETKVTVKNLTGETYAPYGGYGFVSTPGGGGMNSYYYYPADPRSMHLSMSYQF